MSKAETVLNDPDQNTTTEDHLTIAEVLLSQSEWAEHLREETLTGLRANQPTTPPVWFYDEPGCDLFSQITFLPEYYLATTERALLKAHAPAIAAASQAQTLVEIGAGSAEKTVTLLQALADQGTLTRYVPMDCSESALVSAADMVHQHFPTLPVHYVVADFNAHLDQMPQGPGRMVAFLGSTIGNLTRTQRSTFLNSIAESLDPDDTFLVCTDLIKSPERLIAAYDDEAGVTAAFNRNALAVMNAELGADFDLTNYQHQAYWDAEAARIEMRLVALQDQEVTFEGLGDQQLHLTAGQWLRTEFSHKFTPTMVADELAAAGMRIHKQWQDDAGDYLITLAKRQ